MPRVKKPARAKGKIGGQGEDRQWYGGPDASFFAGKPFRFSGIRGVTGTHRGVRDRTKEQGGVEQRYAVALPQKCLGAMDAPREAIWDANPHPAKSS